MLVIRSAALEAVAVKPAQYPGEPLPEIAFAGRSNVGKSSLINLLVRRRDLARTSSSPGKTRTINFYRVNDAFRIVDLPGYGYAKVSRADSESWGPMIEGYLAGRPQLRRVVLLLDARHAPSAQDLQMYDWIRHYGLGGLIVATKADKLSRSELQKNLAMLRRSLAAGAEEKILPVSALKKSGADALLAEMEAILEAGAAAPPEAKDAE